MVLRLIPTKTIYLSNTNKEPHYSSSSSSSTTATAPSNDYNDVTTTTIISHDDNTDHNKNEKQQQQQQSNGITTCVHNDSHDVDNINETNVTNEKNDNNNNNNIDDMDQDNEVDNENMNDQNEYVDIRLNDKEELLFDLLRNAAIAYSYGQIQISSDNNTNNNDIIPKQQQQAVNDVSSSNCNNVNTNTAATTTTTNTNTPIMIHPLITIRIAGGWVRDKILNLDSHDIDVVIDQQYTGVQFAMIVQEYIKQQSHDISISSRIGIIQSNPEQSKHLETATMKIYNIDIDFVNLRSNETYTDTSRIPTITFGTPYDDAMRRDFTCNSLYYNINNYIIEDYISTGYNDLILYKILKTPIDAYITFIDDPLRILRAIRFSVRYHLTIDNNITNAAKDPGIQTALQTKVSRERVGKELDGMLCGKNCNPIQSFKYIIEWNLQYCIFTFPSNNIKYNNNNDNDNNDDIIVTKKKIELNWNVSYQLLNIFSVVIDSYTTAIKNDIFHSTLTTSIDNRLLPLAIILSPFRHYYYDEKASTTATTREYRVTQYVVKDSIKFTNKDVLSIHTYMEYVNRMIHILNKYNNNDNVPVICSNNLNDRLEIGLIIRDCKDLWLSCFILATVLKIHQEQQQQVEQVQIVQIQIQEKWIHISYQLLNIIINDMKLEECWKMKPLLDGKDMIQLLQLKKSPIIGTLLTEQMKWILQNPYGTKEQCQLFIKQYYNNEQLQQQSILQQSDDQQYDDSQETKKRAKQQKNN